MNKLFIGVGLMLCAAAVLPPPASADKGRKELQDSIKHADERDLHIPFVRVSFFTPFSGGQRTPRLPTPPRLLPSPLPEMPFLSSRNSFWSWICRIL